LQKIISQNDEYPGLIETLLLTIINNYKNLVNRWRF